MLWQTIFAGLLVLAAGVYLVRAILNASRAQKGGCGMGCRCSQTPTDDKLGRRRELVQLGGAQSTAESTADRN